MPEPHVWLLPDGTVALKRNSDWMEVDRWGSFYDGESHATHIEFLDELPDAAVPLVALPNKEVYRDDSGLITPADRPGNLYFTTTTPAEAADEARALLARAAQMLAVQRLLEQEKSTVEEARRKVLQDLKPGVYAVLRKPFQDIWLSKTCAGYVTPDGRLMVCRPGSREPEDCTAAYPAEGWTYHLLAEGDLSPVAAE